MNIHTSNELDKMVSELVSRYDIYSVMKHHDLVGDGQKLELLDQSGRFNRYYQYLPCLIQLIEPMQIVEIGAAAGISTTQMALSMPKACDLYSVDNDPEIAWKWMNTEFKRVHKILGDSRDISIYPEELDLTKTDIWFFDSLHVPEQIKKEMEIYSPFFKKGAILLFDDVHIEPEFEKACNEIRDGKYGELDWLDISTPNHWSGFSLCLWKGGTL